MPWYTSEMQAVVALSVQSSRGVAKLHRNISHDCTDKAREVRASVRGCRAQEQQGQDTDHPTHRWRERKVVAANSRRGHHEQEKRGARHGRSVGKQERGKPKSDRQLRGGRVVLGFMYSNCSEVFRHRVSIHGSEAL